MLSSDMSDEQTHPESDLVQDIAAELRALVGHLKRRMREQSDGNDLTPSQASVLLRLERDGEATVSALSRAEGVRPQSMRATVAALEAAGHVAGRQDPVDGRQTIISITDECRRWIAESRIARQDWLARQLAAKLTRDECVHVTETLQLLRRLVDDG
jgi:DNA-binding MarR family transcriptional regulator